MYLLEDPLKIITFPQIQHQSLVFLCSIGNPDSFKRTLESCDLQGVLRAYPDHYRYQQKDLDVLTHWMQKRKKEAIVTTEKDAVKLKNLKCDKPCYVVEMDLLPSEAFSKQATLALNGKTSP